MDASFKVTLPRVELDDAHANQQFTDQIDAIVFGGHHLAAEGSDAHGDPPVDGNEKDGESHAGQKRQTHLRIQEVELQGQNNRIKKIFYKSFLRFF